GAHQLLEQVGLLVAALGRAEACQCARAVFIAQSGQPTAGHGERFLPAGLAKLITPVGRYAAELRVLRRAFASHQRHGEPVGTRDVVEPEATLDAEPTVIGRTVAAIGADDARPAGPVLDLPGELATDPAERAQRVDLPIARAGDDRGRNDRRYDARGHPGIEPLRQQRAGRTHLHALAATHTGRRAHRVVLIEDDLRGVAAPGVADHSVGLL